MTRAALKASILALLGMAADAIFEETNDRPDVLLAPGTISREQAARLRSSTTAQTERSEWIAALESSYYDRMLAEASEYEIKHAQLVWQLALDAEQASLRMPLGSSLIPKSLVRWAVAQLKEDYSTLSRVYVYLTLKDTLDWELAHTDTPEDGSAMGRLQSEYVKKVQADAGRQVTFVDEAGKEVTLDNVTDSPAQAVDRRGWDRPTSYARRAATAEPKQKAHAFATVYADHRGQEFTLSNCGWTYNRLKVSTTVAQRLDRRLDRGQLTRVK